MYIDYLTQMNESHVKVAEFNTAQDFPPEFELEEYYHKVSFRFCHEDCTNYSEIKTVQWNKLMFDKKVLQETARDVLPAA